MAVLKASLHSLISQLTESPSQFLKKGILIYKKLESLIHFSWETFSGLGCYLNIFRLH